MLMQTTLALYIFLIFAVICFPIMILLLILTFTNHRRCRSCEKSEKGIWYNFQDKYIQVEFQKVLFCIFSCLDSLWNIDQFYNNSSNNFDKTNTFSLFWRVRAVFEHRFKWCINVNTKTLYNTFLKLYHFLTRMIKFIKPKAVQVSHLI